MKNIMDKIEKIHAVFFGLPVTIICCMAILNLFGCATVKENTTEPKARDAAQWIAQRSGFIQNAVSAITHVAVYAAEKDTFERQRTLEIMNAVAGNINILIDSGNVDAESIRKALKIDEPYFGPLFSSIALLIHSEIQNFEGNGHADLVKSILIAVSAGIRDGSVTE